MTGPGLYARFGSRLGSLDRLQATLAGALLIALVALCDHLTGTEISFSLFYLLPVGLLTWSGGRALGLAGALVSTGVWLLVEQAGGQGYSNSAIVYWNALVRGGFFLTVCLLLDRLRTAIERERELSRTDPLTGAFNKRFFIELLELEVLRFGREQRPFTLAYIDLDNFKQVNDRDGHLAGDATLRTVVNALRKQLRRVDLVGRLGGDEFALLLVDTGSTAAAALVSKLQATLNAEMSARRSPVRLSIGALTCTAQPGSADALLGAADRLMYSAKRGGKDRAVFADWPEIETGLQPVHEA